MKKYILLAFTLVLAISLTSCLKDKGYNNYEYGFKDGVDGGPAVSFPMGSGLKDTAVVAGSISPTTSSFTSIDIISIALENTTPLSTPTTITIALNPGLLTNTGLTPFPAGAVTIPTQVTIPAGKSAIGIPITFVNSSLLSLTTTYGIGISITGVSNGFKILNTRNNVVAQYNLKNKYDGRYSLNGIHNRPPYNQFPYTDITMDMYTTGSSSVRFFIPSASFNSFGHPIGTAPGVIGWYGPTVSPVITFDEVTNLVTNVNNADPTGPPISIYTGAGSGVGRYDPVAKKIYVYFRYNANDLRAFLDTLIYTAPRP